MAKKKSHRVKKKSDSQLGLDLEHFRIALEAVQELEKDHRILALSSPHGSVRFVDDAGHFTQAYQQGMKTTGMKDDDARKALDELRGFLQLALFFQSEKQRLRFLEEEVYDQALKKLSVTDKKRVQEIWKDKFKLIDEQPMYRRLSRRAKRVATALAPCIVDADTELVRTRRPGLSEQSVTVPFLRISLRCAQNTESMGFPSFFGANPWSDRTALASNKSFQFECDESDIDLLIRRLLAAKVLLAGELDRKKSEGARS